MSLRLLIAISSNLAEAPMSPRGPGQLPALRPQTADGADGDRLEAPVTRLGGVNFRTPTGRSAVPAGRDVAVGRHQRLSSTRAPVTLTLSAARRTFADPSPRGRG